MLIAGGAPSELAPFTAVLQVLADSFVFRLGGVLVGTQAFRCYSNMLGVRFDAETLRTADIDVAGNPSLSVAVAREASLDLLDRLRSVEPRFAAVPELDPRDPPARYALHKLWVAGTRPVSEQPKARKDLAQARQLLDVLRADRPADVDTAAAAMRKRPAMWKRIERELEGR